MLFFLFYMCGFQHTDLKEAFYCAILIDPREDTSRNRKSIRGCLLKSRVTDAPSPIARRPWMFVLEVLIDNDLVGVKI